LLDRNTELLGKAEPPGVVPDQNPGFRPEQNPAQPDRNLGAAGSKPRRSRIKTPAQPDQNIVQTKKNLAPQR